MQVTLAISDDPWLPFYNHEKGQNKLQGMWAEMFDALFVKELGWDLVYLFRPWSRAQNEVKQGTADLFVSVPTSERLNYTIASDLPFFRLPMQLYTYEGHPRMAEILNIRAAEDIKRLDLLMVSNLGNGWHKANIEDKGVRTHWVKSDEQIMQFLALKRADGAIDAPPSMNLLIKRLGLENQVVLTDVTFGTLEFFLLVGKKSPVVDHLDEINAALAKLLKSGTFQTIYEKYL